MSKVFIIHRRHILLSVCLLVLVLAAMLYGDKEHVLPAFSAEATDTGRTIQMVTGEFSSKTSDGREIEAYRWDPGTVVVNKGETVNLHIYGVNGDSHPFVIEGLNVKGEVKKGQETVVTFTADKAGTYRIICLTHADMAHNGPMVGYIVVQ
ncbi:cupredoxin domain-containing protein [Paenibacillus athensensis]|uniref:EfeO-type cupredoxin-like domain-containing protein n=1 Tax=Paenibacillus athensensis TaxID=1967502 RepID=A0A4Y8Q089_9BACL|nr:cupredoxin domain-containing protein [Paenibacillus athensensis]MCD1261103.1 cupredoxin domain-containing protein [Paenibacillus athensensis]